MSKKLTPWFPSEVKPARKGHYERDYGFGDEDIADYWDGNNWWICPVDDPLDLTTSTSNLPWRGLAKKP